MKREKANPRMAMMMTKCEKACESNHDGGKRVMPPFFEEGLTKKKMKTEEEVVLAYPPREDGKKRKKVVKRLGKEEVERLLSVKVTVPTIRESVLASPSVPARYKELLLRGAERLRAGAMSMRENQDLIRAQFEAKGYVDVLAEVSDDEMEMQPVQLHL